ncbi:MAG: hypothetical protein HYU66_17590 [Armatimonadetes bacterium]|nr:hypothetical protein [Armatimonadota bacterium]
MARRGYPSSRAAGVCLLLLATAALAAPRVREIDFRLPCPAAAPAGLAVRLAVPETGRYGNEAPVVVHVGSGWSAGDLSRIEAPLAAEGFVELRFCFPGGGRPGFASGGALDYRGAGSLEALARVLAFAAGLAIDADGRSIRDLAAPLQPLGDDVGVLGWGNGGNAAIVALAEYSREARGVAWVATWETPLGDGAATALGGDWRNGPNACYDADSGQCDWARLGWAENLPVPIFGGLLGSKGTFYLDVNRDGKPDRNDCFPAAYPALDAAGRVRYAFPAGLAREAGRRVTPWPPHLLNPDEAADYWSLRDAAGHLLKATVSRENLLAMVLATARDHVQTSPAHPHVAAAYLGWLAAKVHWLRLNPDAAYLSAVQGGAAAQVTETMANLPLTRTALVSQLLPAGTPPSVVGAAAACELADRVHARNLDVDLDAVLFPVAALVAP